MTSILARFNLKTVKWHTTKTMASHKHNSFGREPATVELWHGKIYPTAQLERVHKVVEEIV